MAHSTREHPSCLLDGRSWGAHARGPARLGDIADCVQMGGTVAPVLAAAGSYGTCSGGWVGDDANGASWAAWFLTVWVAAVSESRLAHSARGLDYRPKAS